MFPIAILPYRSGFIDSSRPFAQDGVRTTKDETASSLDGMDGRRLWARNIGR